eukprot:COSAG04_NODE_8169_length_1012_cov_1.177437_1_plen_313_part_10
MIHDFSRANPGCRVVIYNNTPAGASPAAGAAAAAGGAARSPSRKRRRGEAAQASVVEQAKTGRAKCQACRETITKGQLRVGFDGSYRGHVTRQWCCARKDCFDFGPTRAAGLSAQALDGFGALPAEEQRRISALLGAAAAGGAAAAEGGQQRRRVASPPPQQQQQAAAGPVQQAWQQYLAAGGQPGAAAGAGAAAAGGAGAAAAAGAGAGAGALDTRTTAASLTLRWQAMPHAADVLPFYSHSGEYKAFSNFCVSPFSFDLPVELSAGGDFPTPVVRSRATLFCSLRSGCFSPVSKTALCCGGGRCARSPRRR